MHERLKVNPILMMITIAFPHVVSIQAEAAMESLGDLVQVSYKFMRKVKTLLALALHGSAAAVAACVNNFIS